MNITNVSGGVRTIAATGQTVEHDETAEVDDDLGRALADQPDVWRAGEAHVCEACGFEAKNAVGLASHQRTHDEENDR